VSQLLLGLIALATLMMAIVQVGAAVYAARLARRVDRLTGRLEHEVQPLLDRLSTIGDQAVRAASLATAQVERVDKLMADVTERVDSTLGEIQRAVVRPVREGMALVNGLRAGFDALRGFGRRAGRPSRRAVEEDEALFIG
jgi:hypothetical protein